MFSTFHVENEVAYLQLSQRALHGSLQKYQICFKTDMSCLKTCMNQVKPLFISLMAHLQDDHVRGKILANIDYDKVWSNETKQKKRASYSSSTYEPWIIDVEGFYNVARNRLVGSFNQHLLKDRTITNIRVRDINIHLCIVSKKVSFTQRKLRKMNVDQKINNELMRNIHKKRFMSENSHCYKS